MSSDKAPRLFPLHLTPLEEFFCSDDRPSHPMTFTVQLHLTGGIDRGAFLEALEQALVRHPLLNAFIQRAKQGKRCWVDAQRPHGPVDWGDFDAPLTLPEGEQIHLANETGLRVWVRQGEDRACVTLQFHHACTDGIGAYRFIGDLLALYGQLVGGDERPPRLEPASQRQLRDRIAMQVEYWRTNRYWEMAKRAGGQLWDMLRRRPKPLATRHGRKITPTPFPGFESTTLPTEDYQRLRETAQSVGGTINDLLLAALFRTLCIWSDETTGRRNGSSLRIMMPTDLRGAEDVMMPAASLTSYAFLTRARADCDHPLALLTGVCEETQRIKNSRGGVRFSDSVAIALKIPGVMPGLLRMPLCLASAVMSNIGDPTRRFNASLPRREGKIVSGNLLLDDIVGVPPLRPQTRATFSAFAYLRRLTISLRCDPQYFTLADTRALLESYRENIARFAPRPVVVSQQSVES